MTGGAEVQGSGGISGSVDMAAGYPSPTSRHIMTTKPTMQPQVASLEFPLKQIIYYKSFKIDNGIDSWTMESPIGVKLRLMGVGRKEGEGWEVPEWSDLATKHDK